jgi:hypothetical protein
MDVSDDSSSEYRPSPPAPQNTKGRKQAPTLPSVPQDKGKQKAVMPSDEETESSTDAGKWQVMALAIKKPTTRRHHPQATGQVHIPPCEKCMKRGEPCQVEMGGGSCVLCTRLKVKCKYSGTKGVRLGHGKKSEAEGKKRTKEKKTPTYVEESSESESEPESSRVSAVPAPAPARRRMALASEDDGK